MVCKNIMNLIAIIVAIVVIAGVTGGVAYFAGLGSEPDDEPPEYVEMEPRTLPGDRIHRRRRLATGTIQT